MKDLFDIFLIYLSSFLKGSMPYKKKGTHILNGWVIYYDIICIYNFEFDDLLKESISVTKDFKPNIFVSDLGRRILAVEYSIVLSEVLKSYLELSYVIRTNPEGKKNRIFLKTLKLRDHSEYKRECRDLIINKLLKT